MVRRGRWDVKTRDIRLIVSLRHLRSALAQDAENDVVFNTFSILFPVRRSSGQKFKSSLSAAVPVPWARLALDVP